MDKPASGALDGPCNIIKALSGFRLSIPVVFFLRLARKVDILVTVEDHVFSGGLGLAVLKTLIEKGDGRLPNIARLGIPDVFPKGYGPQDTMLEMLGLQPEYIANAIRKSLL